MQIDRNRLDEFCLRQLKDNGFITQGTVAVEESAEYVKEICKFMRGSGNRSHLIEEMADVIITMHQMMHNFGITDGEIADAIEYKMRRTAWRK